MDEGRRSFGDVVVAEGVVELCRKTEIVKAEGGGAVGAEVTGKAVCGGGGGGSC